jgi:hypothetical protein
MDHTLYPEREKYAEFNISEVLSIKTPSYGEAKMIEDKFKKKYRKNFNIEKYLNKPYSYYGSHNLTGISEFFILEDGFYNMNDIIGEAAEISDKMRIK